MPPTSLPAPERRRVRVLLLAATAAPVLALAPVVIRDEQYRREELIGYIGGWTFYTWAAIGIAVLDLRRRSSRGRLAFLVGVAATLLAIVLAFGGGLVVAPSLALIPVAASMRSASGSHQARVVACALLLALASLLYLLVLFSD